MSTEQIYINALLADATYVDRLVENATAEALATALSPRMTPTLAKFIGDNFEVASRVNSDDWMASGFDATVWRGRAGTPFAGKIYVSMRGTEGAADFATDAVLALTGNAGQQVIDMVNWWLRITTPVGQGARQLAFDAVSGFMIDTAGVPGAGLISSSELISGIEVNGHSLGGYLASAFTRLLGTQAHVAHTTTLNSAGFALGSESAFAELTRAIGPGYGRNGFPAAGDPSQTNAFALHGLNLTTNTFWFSQVGQRVELFNEESSTQVPNHFMYKLTDSLSLAVAMRELDTSMTTGGATVLFEAGSNAVAGSLEGVLDGLRRVLLDPSTGALPIGDVSASAGSRVAYHQTLKQLQDSPLFQALKGKVTFAATHGGSVARSDFGAFASMLVGAPFSMHVTDSAAEDWLAGIHRDTYSRWLSDRNNAAMGADPLSLNFTDAYLQDRAAFLNAAVAKHVRDEPYTATAYRDGLAPLSSYADLTSGLTINSDASSTPLARVAFGSQGGDTISGGARGDRLYGGGIDTLSGNGGADRLEGNAGDDTLDGGEGSDMLLGGAGFDTYDLNGDFGRDVVLDADGFGQIRWNGAGLPSGKLLVDGVYQSDDRAVTYTLVAAGSGRNDLVISFRNSSNAITVRNWSSERSLGIQLESTPAARPATASSFIGDFIKLIQDNQYVIEGSRYVAAGSQPGAADILLGTQGNDLMQGLGGADALFAGVGDDVLEGGEGGDVLQGGHGHDWLIGGAGADLIYGSGIGSMLNWPREVGSEHRTPVGAIVLSDGFGWSNSTDVLSPDELVDGYFSFDMTRTTGLNDDGNVIDAGSGHDFVAAGTNDDVVYGGSEPDRILGMGGNDDLLGGDGNDLIQGDAGIMRSWGGGSYVPQTIAEQQGADILVGGGGDDRLYGQGSEDSLYGGEGDDKLWGDSPSAMTFWEASPSEAHASDFLDGGEGRDQLFGGGGEDTLYGGTESDTLLGDDWESELAAAYHGADVLNGGDGDDVLLGGGGNDVLVGGSGNDWLAGGDETDVTASSNLDGDDTLDGGDGVDTLVGGRGNDILLGGAGRDGLFGGSGNDALRGGAGVDFLDGGEGDDVFEVGTGELTFVDGHPVLVVDTVVATSGQDIIRATGLNQSETQIGFSAGSVTFSHGSEGVMVVGGLTSAIAALEFGDGRADYRRLLNERLDTPVTAASNGASHALFGGARDDTLTVGAADALTTVSAGRGADTVHLNSTQGATMQFARGDGSDFVSAAARSVGEQGPHKNILALDQGILPSDLQLLRTTPDRYALALGGANDAISFDVATDPQTGAVLASSWPFDEVHFGDGTVWNWQDIVSALAAPTLGTEGNDTIAGTPFSEAINGLGGNDTLRGGAGNDLLDGGPGHDALHGEDGNDTLLNGETMDGGSGNDRLVRDSAAGNFTFSSGWLRGGDGNDTYEVAMPMGGFSMILDDQAGVDRLVLSSVNLGDLQVGFEGEYLRLSTFAGARMYIDRGITSSVDRIVTATGETTLAQLVGDRHGFAVFASSNRDQGTLIGGAAADTLTERAEDAGVTVSGGRGNDTLRVQSADGATVVFRAGDGLDEITTVARTAGARNVLRLEGPGAADVRLFSAGPGSFRIGTGSTEGVRFAASVDPASGAPVAGQAPFDELRFTDGTVMSWQQLIARGIGLPPPIEGTAGNDNLIGTGGADTINGLAGNDSISAGAGNDVVDGGAGTDTLYGEDGDDRLVDGERMYGGNGNDTYVVPSMFSSVDIWDYGTVDSGHDVLVLTPDHRPSSVGISRSGVDGRDLVIRPAATGNPITLLNFAATQDGTHKIEEIRFADGTVWNLDAIWAADHTDDVTSQDDGVLGHAWGETIDGGAGDDRIDGLGGADVLDGGSGADLLIGGSGNDAYRFGAGRGHDVVLEQSAGAGESDEVALDVTTGRVGLFRDGRDLVVAIDAGADQLRVQGYFADQGSGNANTGLSVETLRFADGTVWGAAEIAARLPAAGVDAMAGTSGNDSFMVDDARDTITEQAGGGIDGVTSGVSYRLPDNIENLTATGRLDLTLQGNGLNNTITGNAGNNVLNGIGAMWWSPTRSGSGGGADTLIGGVGDDTYYVGGSAYGPHAQGIVRQDDTVVENAGEGTDTIVFQGDSLAFMAVLPANVERLVGYGALALVGNELDNVIEDVGSLFGVQTAVLDGGAGADLLIGSVKSNVYVVDNAGDVIDERGVYGNGTEPQGRDEVRASVTHSLGERLEDLVLVGSQAIAGAGNSKGNLLDGSANTAANVLAGGAGDDTYRLDGSDSVVEGAGQGVDTATFVRSVAGTLDVAGFANVERFVLDNALPLAAAAGLRTSGSAAVELIGNAGSNELIGGSGDDLLQDQATGGTAQDADVLRGGAGNDRLRSLAGADMLDGGTGDDVIEGANIVFGTGYGHDVATAGSYHVHLNPGVDGSSLLLERAGAGLLVRIGDDVLTLRDALQADTGDLLRGVAVSFADGAELQTPEVRALLLAGSASVASPGDDVLLGSNAADTLGGLSGNDSLYGLGGDDSLDGGDGDDRLAGGAGADTLVGGAGDDSFGASGADLGNDSIAGGAGSDAYYGAAGDGADVYSFAAGWGHDTAYHLNDDELVFEASVRSEDLGFWRANDDDNRLVVAHDASGSSIALQGFFHADGSPGHVPPLNLRLRFADEQVLTYADLSARATGLRGTAGNDTLTASAGVSQLYGLAGDDRLTGTAVVEVLDGGAGNDTLAGGAGNDTYIVDSTSDIVTESSGAGIDLVMSGVSWTLGANVENLALTGTSAINATGNTLANVLNGNAANNTLSGGAGADTLAGGAGNDTYLVDSTADVVTEGANAGVDTIQSSVSFTLSANVENLVLTGSGATNATGNAIDNVLTGNTAANRLTGGAGNDTLDGKGGSDTLLGGAGNDIYVVDVSTDVVTELANEGVDLVNSSVTRTLASNVENLTLTGTSAINATGNTLANVLTGNNAVNTLTGGAGNDTLNGMGGIDRMVGGAGNDIYVVDVGGETLTENANEGSDTVNAAVTWTLGTHLENLTLTGGSAINGTGNTVANVLTGNGANNTLTGLAGNDTLDGGAGTDTLVGGTGADVYRFGRGWGVDTVQENDATAGVRDRVEFGANVLQSDIQVLRNGNNLEVALRNTSDRLVMRDWYLGSRYHVEDFRFSDGSVLTDNQVQGLVGAMATFAAPSAAAMSASAQSRMQRPAWDLLAVQSF